jgi:hypothetical protein
MHSTARTCFLYRGHARDQAILSSAIPAEAYFRFQASPWGVSDGQSDTRDRFFSEYFSFPLFSIIAQMVCADISFMYHRRCLFVAIDNVIKWSTSLWLSAHLKSALILVVFSSLEELQKTQYLCNMSVYAYLRFHRIVCAASLHRGEYLYFYNLKMEAERFSESVLSAYQTTSPSVRESRGLHNGVFFNNRGVKFGTAYGTLYSKPLVQPVVQSLYPLSYPGSSCYFSFPFDIHTNVPVLLKVPGSILDPEVCGLMFPWLFSLSWEKCWDSSSE